MNDQSPDFAAAEARHLDEPRRINADTAEVVMSVTPEIPLRPERFIVAHYERTGTKDNLGPGYEWWTGKAVNTLAEVEMDIELHDRDYGAIRHDVIRIPGEPAVPTPEAARYREFLERAVVEDGQNEQARRTANCTNERMRQ